MLQGVLSVCDVNDLDPQTRTAGPDNAQDDHDDDPESPLRFLSRIQQNRVCLGGDDRIKLLLACMAIRRESGV